jgi:hypothetical protein
MDQVINAVDVRAALSTLIPVHRQVIVEMYLRDRSVAQVADLLRIPEGSVKSRACYAVRQLREVLSAAPGDAPPNGDLRKPATQASRPPTLIEIYARPQVSESSTLSIRRSALKRQPCSALTKTDESPCTGEGYRTSEATGPDDARPGLVTVFLFGGVSVKVSLPWAVSARSYLVPSWP